MTGGTRERWISTLRVPRQVRIVALGRSLQSERYGENIPLHGACHRFASLDGDHPSGPCATWEFGPQAPCMLPYRSGEELAEAKSRPNGGQWSVQGRFPGSPNGG
jgi:hypothetical protein